jgi:hypothetical protein
VVSGTEETKATGAIHRGCGGTVLVSLDGEVCARCGTDLDEGDWLPGAPPPGATLDELRLHAERISQESGMATVIVAVGGEQYEYVTSPAVLGRYTDPAVGALVEALHQRQGALR